MGCRTAFGWKRSSLSRSRPRHPARPNRRHARRPHRRRRQSRRRLHRHLRCGRAAARIASSRARTRRACARNPAASAMPQSRCHAQMRTHVHTCAREQHMHTRVPSVHLPTSLCACACVPSTQVGQGYPYCTWHIQPLGHVTLDERAQTRPPTPHAPPTARSARPTNGLHQHASAHYPLTTRMLPRFTRLIHAPGSRTTCRSGGP